MGHGLHPADSDSGASVKLCGAEEDPRTGRSITECGLTSCWSCLNTGMGCSFIIVVNPSYILSEHLVSATFLLYVKHSIY